MEQLKILVVDDESRMRKLVRDFLTRSGYIVIEAGDGSEALDIFFAQKDIALIILDVMMPEVGWLAGVQGNPHIFQSAGYYADCQIR